MRFWKIFKRLVKCAKAQPLPPVVLTTSPIARLPDELIESIFELLPSSWDFHTERSHALAPCLLVCKRFYRLARPLVWRHVHLSLKRDVESVFLSEGQVIMQSTVALSLYGEGTTADAMSEEDVCNAFDCFPRSEEVTLGGQCLQIPWDRITHNPYLTSLTFNGILSRHGWPAPHLERLVKLEFIDCAPPKIRFLTPSNFPSLRALCFDLPPYNRKYYAQLDGGLLDQLEILQIPLFEILGIVPVPEILHRAPTLLHRSAQCVEVYCTPALDSLRIWPNLQFIEHLCVASPQKPHISLHMYPVLKTLSLQTDVPDCELAELIDTCRDMGITVVSVDRWNKRGINSDFWVYAKRQRDKLEQA
ncbi:hypothetical protein NBRC10512_004101 [Rhodotorula toruloides]|uniref:RHTO0S03e01310g1_1 n=2 Tax=Rhodotorula toruloides TaxID=5286 RepID=A0A061ATF0_RHOTO|nr:uncharacterized protein RHTO_00093 [Rhodotorula toruloides NP11]EMS25665.1 hypothetical protein RHTO_00093 [Rhodotorula toruloides NP11]CDR37956.1 RHTO0S03e01310g1_1 [Rhodotorula toruloides]